MREVGAECLGGFVKDNLVGVDGSGHCTVCGTGHHGKEGEGVVVTCNLCRELPVVGFVCVHNMEFAVVEEKLAAVGKHDCLWIKVWCGIEHLLEVIHELQAVLVEPQSLLLGKDIVVRLPCSYEFGCAGYHFASVEGAVILFGEVVPANDKCPCRSVKLHIGFAVKFRQNVESGAGPFAGYVEVHPLKRAESGFGVGYDELHVVGSRVGIYQPVQFLVVTNGVGLGPYNGIAILDGLVAVGVDYPKILQCRGIFDVFNLWFEVELCSQLHVLQLVPVWHAGCVNLDLCYRGVLIVAFVHVAGGKPR
ncbi:hypothetical protein SDC9_87949 [bioreactor metagenome]|uniref:Uncharacterized protein n=1 Tax=bioreactor metagenome TaxID=1076179 RepID=A0A644ZKB5_9ZZZZ